MPTKISNATKRQALEKLRDGMTVKEVTDMFGISQRTVGRWKAGMTGKTAKPPRNAPANPPAPPDATNTSQTGDEGKTALDFEASPEPVEKKGVVDSALSSLKGMLGDRKS